VDAPKKFAPNSHKHPAHKGAYVIDANLFGPAADKGTSYICELSNKAQPGYRYIVIENQVPRAVSFEELQDQHTVLFKIVQTLSLYSHNYLAQIAERVSHLEQLLAKK
jgi:hypothetical protein